MRPLLLVLAVTLTACRTAGPTGHELPDYGPLASARSPCGRYDLHLDAASWMADSGRGPRLSLQFSFRDQESGVHLCGKARITDLVPEDGTEFREADLKGFASEDRSGNLSFHDLETYAPSARLQRLRVEVHVLRVFSWRSFPLSCEGPGKTAETVCPPFHVGVSGFEDHLSVSAYATDDWRSFPPAERDLFGIIGHDWVALGVDWKDATGQSISFTGAAGSGGHTVVHYGSLPPTEPGKESPPRISYPARGVLRLPERYVVEVVPFEFVDVPMSRGDETIGR